MSKHSILIPFYQIFIRSLFRNVFHVSNDAIVSNGKPCAEGLLFWCFDISFKLSTSHLYQKDLQRRSMLIIVANQYDVRPSIARQTVMVFMNYMAVEGDKTAIK